MTRVQGFMRIVPGLILAFTVLSTAAQDARQLLISQATALQAATTEAMRDSLSAQVAMSLRAVLNAADGLTANMDDVPLSRIDAPDGRFRLITWNLPRENGEHRFHGMLLVQRGKKSILHELYDATSVITNPELAELEPTRWYGALYYAVVPAKKGGRIYYTLLGWKGHSTSETRKVIEVLSFRGDKPRFGAPLFGGEKLKVHRKIFGFAAQSSMMLQYEAEQQRIVLDHLSAVRADMEGKAAFMGPDMSFDAYVWDKGQWNYQRDIDLRDPQRGRPFNQPPPPPRP
jgi:hypothetical protein